PRSVQLLATVAIVGFTCLNILGVREGVVTQNIVTFAKIAVVLGLVVLAFGGRAGSWTNLIAHTVDRPVGLVAVAASLIGPLAAFDGWITISYMGGEVKRPERNLPFAAFASVAIVAALYLALNASYLVVLGSSRVADSPLVASDTARALIGPRGADLAAAMVVIATMGGLHGNILAGARVLYAMAAAGLFF